jgi:uncharacterized membrane protein
MMNRKQLDAFVEHYGLPEPVVRDVLELAGARPSRSDESQFLSRALLLGGILSLAAGVIFFVAANWDALKTLGRFALLEIVLVAAVVVALWKPPPAVHGRLALLAAFFVAGALFALFGQTYQTGADVYELFLTWAVVALPLALAAQWSASWAAWVFVLDVALALYCGWQPRGGPLFWLFAGFGMEKTILLMLAAFTNLVLWGGAEAVARLRPASAVSRQLPDWLRRFVLAWAIFFGTWAGVVAVLFGPGYGSILTPDGAWTLVLWAGVLAGIGVHAFRTRRDVFPVAMIAGSVIVLGCVIVGRVMRGGETAVVFMLAFWLIASSTIAGRLLMSLVRNWRTEARET